MERLFFFSFFQSSLLPVKRTSSDSIQQFRGRYQQLKEKNINPKDCWGFWNPIILQEGPGCSLWCGCYTQLSWALGWSLRKDCRSSGRHHLESGEQEASRFCARGRMGYGVWCASLLWYFLGGGECSFYQSQSEPLLGCSLNIPEISMLPKPRVLSFRTLGSGGRRAACGSAIVPVLHPQWAAPPLVVTLGSLQRLTSGLAPGVPHGLLNLFEATSVHQKYSNNL